jgi:hypothetical protein
VVLENLPVSLCKSRFLWFGKTCLYFFVSQGFVVLANLPVFLCKSRFFFVGLFSKPRVFSLKVKVFVVLENLPVFLFVNRGFFVGFLLANLACSP